MFIRFTLIFLLSLTCILPIFYYFKELHFAERPVFFRRIEEKLAVYFPRLFDNSDKKNQIDYGYNAGSDPEVLPEPPKAIARKQHQKLDFTAAPSILAQDWTEETNRQPTSESSTQTAPENIADPINLTPFKEEAEQKAALDQAPLTLDQQVVELPGDLLETQNTLLEAANSDDLIAKPDSGLTESPTDEPSAEILQAAEGTEPPRAPKLFATPQLIATRNKELGEPEELPTETSDENKHSTLTQGSVSNVQAVEPVTPTVTETEAFAYQQAPLAKQDSRELTATADGDRVEPELNDIQKQLAAQQTLEQIEKYAELKREEQAAKDLAHQKQLENIQAQIERQQVVAETLRLRQDQSLWIQELEDLRDNVAQQQQVIEAEVQRLKLIKQAQAQAEQEALKQQALAEQQALQQQVEAAEQQAKAKSLKAEQAAREQQALAEQQEQALQAQMLEQQLQAVAAEQRALQQQVQAAEQAAREQLALVEQKEQALQAEKLEQQLQAVAAEQRALQQQVKAAEQSAREQQALAEQQEQALKAERLALQQQALAAEKRALEQQTLAHQQARADAEALARSETLRAEQLVLERRAERAEQAEQERLAAIAAQWPPLLRMRMN